MACGAEFSMVVDCKGNLYSFGCPEYGQLGMLKCCNKFICVRGCTCKSTHTHTPTHLCRIRWVLRCQLHGIMTCPKDIKTRKLLTKHGGFHPKSSTLRLFIKRKDGGRGLVNVRATIQDEATKIWEYTQKMAFYYDLLSGTQRGEGRKRETITEGQTLHRVYAPSIIER